jgi:hypothetical protein
VEKRPILEAIRDVNAKCKFSEQIRFDHGTVFRKWCNLIRCAGWEYSFGHATVFPWGFKPNSHSDLLGEAHSDTRGHAVYYILPAHWSRPTIVGRITPLPNRKRKSA